VPFPTRLLGVASHTCSGPASHRHQRIMLDREVISAGVSSPFLVGCHCAATLGAREVRRVGLRTYVALPPALCVRLRSNVRRRHFAVHDLMPLRHHLGQSVRSNTQSVREPPLPSSRGKLLGDRSTAPISGSWNQYFLPAPAITSAGSHSFRS
jgi:hypothetical protein